MSGTQIHVFGVLRTLKDMIITIWGMISKHHQLTFYNWKCYKMVALYISSDYSEW